MHNRNDIKNSKPPALTYARSYVINHVERAGGRNAAKEKRSTYYAYDANGQVMATYTVTNTATIKKAQVDEHVIYGNGRIGLVQEDAQIFVFINQVTLPNEGPYWTQKTGKKNYELTNYLGNVNAVITDRKVLDPTNPVFKAVVVATTDYYAFGMAMPGRQTNAGAYRFGYNGMEIDKEMSGNGNSYTTEFRQYDPRLGRWKSCDPKRHWFPSMSAYCYASNTPIVGKDDNGLYTIFVNGYIYGAPNYTVVTNRYTGETYEFNDDIEPGKSYWDDRGSDFIIQAHKYLGDGIGRYVNGTGSWAGSTAADRQKAGRIEGKKIALEIIAEIHKLNSDLNPDGTLNTSNDVTEINFVTHSMGTAHSEGMIEEFMKHEDLRKLLEKGQIIHLSACDGDKIKISENSKHLNRTQLNIMYDKTLWWADKDARNSGGYNIKGISKMGVIDETVSNLHPGIKNPGNFNPHFDTKSWAPIWDYMRVLDSHYNIDKNGGGIEYLRKSDLSPIEDTIINPQTKNKV